MILDEATSSIDTHTEAIVQKGMDALMTGRTVFVIAHRLSTVQNSDAIMVLDHGRIIERGTHDQLIAQHGTYYQLYTGAWSWSNPSSKRKKTALFRAAFFVPRSGASFSFQKGKGFRRPFAHQKSRPLGRLLRVYAFSRKSSRRFS